MSTTRLRDWALRLAAHGWPIFPLRPGSKVPALHGRDRCPRLGACAGGHRGWEQRATTDPEVILRCWSHGAYNVAVATGPAGLVVIDLDVPKDGQALPDGWNMPLISSGADVLAYLMQRAGQPLPDTFTVRTATGGRHLYFRCPHGVQLRNTAGVVGPLIDTRAYGGYVVAPGSIVASGGYELLADHEPATLPGWLVRALNPKSRETNSAPREIATGHLSRYLRAALDRESARVTGALAGTRNKALFVASCALGQLVASNALPEHDARVVLEHAAEPHLTAGAYDARQRDNTITSGFRVGASRPRRIQHRGRVA